MSTTLQYLSDSYQKTSEAKILKIEEINNQTIIYLDQTIFYAQGGGQPADQGKIIGSQGQLLVTHVSYNGGELQHKGKQNGSLLVGETVQLEIDWEKRYQHMQWHTAGHILDQAVKNVISSIHGVNGEHGIGKKLYVEFDALIPQDSLPAIQTQLEKIIASDLVISAEMMTKDEILKRKIHVPFDLPSNKPLRIVQIGTYPAMPDGGTQLKTTGESLSINATQIIEKDGKWRVIYTVGTEEQKPKTTDNLSKNPASQHYFSISTLKNEIEKITTLLATDATGYEALKTKYLGKNGLFNELAKSIKNTEPADRKVAGQMLNELKMQVETEIAKRHSTHIQTSDIDLTMPGIPPKVGHMHPVSQAMEEITHIFEKIGFTRVRYPEVEWDWYAFEAMNMQPSHPARDEWETFFVNAPASPEKGKMILTPHTSNGQVREMERLNHKPPIRMINISRTYRRQQDATHTQMFHQFEGLVVDKGINIQHLKGTLDYFAREFYGEGTKSRIRPFHFQFTEPSFEVDFSCHICDGTGIITTNGETTKCKFCKSGWHEVGGAGMVHPNVLKAGGIDPEEYTGFAFGWGIERTYSLKEGLQIDDIRLLYSGDLRFLQQF